MYRNSALQLLIVRAYADAGHASLDAGEPVTGDAAQITGKVSTTYGVTLAPIGDTNPTELENGLYYFQLSDAETDGYILLFTAVSSTPGVQVEVLPSEVIYTEVLSDTAASNLDLMYNGTGYTADTAPASRSQLNATINYAEDAVVVVDVAGLTTDTARGEALKTAYTTAKALTPGGNALSGGNRATVLIPPCKYDIGATALTCDTSYVDLIAMEPEMGGIPTDAELDLSSFTLDNYHPSRTQIVSTTDTVDAVIQSAQNVRMVGLTIANLSTNTGGSTVNECHGLNVTAATNAGSVYEQMTFFILTPARNGSQAATHEGREPVHFEQSVSGTWKKCICNAYGWRIGLGDNNSTSVFEAQMEDCWFGRQSVIGDPVVSADGIPNLTQKASGATFTRCHGGWGTYGGCGEFGLGIDETCLLIDCTAHDKSVALAYGCAATIIGGKFGKWCCGSGGENTSGNTMWVAGFSGIAINVTAGEGSFGGTTRTDLTTPPTCSGTLRNVTITGNTQPLRLEGATIDNCLIEQIASDIDGVTLADDTSRITGSTILVVESGTGVPINAASARTVAASENRFNNRDVTTTGLGETVTSQGSGSGRLASDGLDDVTPVDANVTQWLGDNTPNVLITGLVPSNMKAIDDVAESAQTLRNWIYSWTTGQIASASGTTITLASVPTDDQFIDDVLIIFFGTGSQQARVIVDCDATANTVTVDEAFLLEPDATSYYIIIPQGQTNLDHMGPLASDALDAIALPDLTDASDAKSSLAKALAWVFRRFASSSMTKTGASTAELAVKNDSGDTITTQSVSDDGVSQDIDEIS